MERKPVNKVTRRDFLKLCLAAGAVVGTQGACTIGSGVPEITDVGATMTARADGGQLTTPATGQTGQDTGEIINNNMPQVLETPEAYSGTENSEIYDPNGYIATSITFNGATYVIEQQPYGNDLYVSPTNFTQHRIAYEGDWGTGKNGIGILGHTTSVGQHIFALPPDAEIEVATASGELKVFSVSEIRGFQAIGPTDDPTSYVDLVSNESFSERGLFNQIYKHPDDEPGDHDDMLTLQACIPQGDNFSWGRYFVIAERVK